MKHLICSIILAIVMGTVAQVQANSYISSINAAGYVKVAVARGELGLLHSPFESFDGSPHTVESMLGTENLPHGTVVYFWNTTTQAYESEQFVDGFGWVPGTRVIGRGEAFFVAVPDTAPKASYDIMLFGEVPDSLTAPDFAQSIDAGLQFVGYHYPTSKSILDTELATIADHGDVLYYWDGSWKSEQYVDGFGWVPGTFVLEPGRGFFYNSQKAKVWTEMKPYSWP